MKLCKLCGKKVDKLCKAHIIPDFMYREHGLFDDKHRLYTFEARGNNIRTGQNFTGVYDRNILCSKCDGDIIGKYETFARKMLFSKADVGVRVQHEMDDFGFQWFLVQNLEYQRFKLFLLSILWKASLTENKFFENIKLSNEEEEKLRDMIFTENPGEELEFPCTIMSYIKLEGAPTDMIFSPRKMKNGERIMYYFPIGGAVYIYSMGKSEDLLFLKDVVLTKDNETRWLLVQTFKELKKIIDIDFSKAS